MAEITKKIKYTVVSTSDSEGRGQAFYIDTKVLVQVLEFFIMYSPPKLRVYDYIKRVVDAREVIRGLEPEVKDDTDEDLPPTEDMPELYSDDEDDLDDGATDDEVVIVGDDNPDQSVDDMVNDILGEDDKQSMEETVSPDTHDPDHTSNLPG